MSHDTTELLRAEPSLLSLPPEQFSCDAQHIILEELQRILEESLFRFGKRMINRTIEGKGWQCAKCVELNDWVKLLRRHVKLLSRERIEKLDRPLGTLLNSMVHIRHASVHRQKMTSAQIMAFVFDSESFLRLLDDQGAIGKVSTLRDQLSAYLRELSAQNDAIRTKLLEITSSSQAKRVQIDLEEHLAVKFILDEAEERGRRSMANIGILTRELSLSDDSTHLELSQHSNCGGSGSDELAVLLCSCCVQALREQEFNAGRKEE